MGKFSAFHFYWEEYGGYPDRDHPFGLPQLTWIVANDGAVGCRVTARPTSASDVRWSAAWNQIPYEIVKKLTDALMEIGAFGKLEPLVQDTEGGDYLVVWDITGALGDRAFHFSLEFTAPSTRWTPSGERFRDVLAAVRRATDGA